MPGATIDRGSRVFTVSQSWLQTFLRCPQRAWYELHDPRPGYNDATATGQALHTFMDLRLNGETSGSARRSAESWLRAVVELDPTFRFVKIKTLDTMLAHLNACIDGMEAHVIPHLQMGGLVEQRMQALLASEGGWVIRLEGTPDYIDPSGVIHDWKSASSEYNAYETTEWAIQPTAYTYLASEHLGVEHSEFLYVILLKPHGEVQFIEVERNPGQWAWLARVAAGALALLRALPNGPWPVNHTHHLCSTRWCPWWDQCRGAVVDGPGLPVQLKGTTAMAYSPDPAEYDEQGEEYQDEGMVDVPGPDTYGGRTAIHPVGEAMTAETQTGMVKITRSINLGSKDNNLHIGAELPVMIQPGWTPDQISAMYTDSFYQLKAVVYEQAGVEFSVDEGGILRETINHHLPGTTEERPPQRGGQRPPGRPSGGGRPSAFPDPRDLEQPPHIENELWDDLVANPTAWYDNRADKANGSKAASWPDFKSKDDGTGIWLAPFRRGSGGGPNRGSRR